MLKAAPLLLSYSVQCLILYKGMCQTNKILGYIYENMFNEN